MSKARCRFTPGVSSAEVRLRPGGSPRVGICVHLVLVVLAFRGPLAAQVQRLEVHERETVAEGRAFGVVGPYEKLTGTVHFALDPEHPGNSQVVDLRHATRQDDSVVYSANFFVLRPVEPQRGNGTLLLEVSNRGGKAQLSFFDRGAQRSRDPSDPQHFGDGFLLRRGFTVAWLGWQHDVPPQPGLLRLDAPRAPGLQGLVRADAVFDEDTATLPLGHRGHVAYPVADPNHPDNVLTVRDQRLERRRVVPRRSWEFARLEGESRVEDPRFITAAAPFEKGRIYEAVYVARDPAIAGLGMTALRDFVAYVKYDDQSPIRARHAIGFGISQSGRFLRHFLYQGFNADLEGRRVFDGVMAHVAGGGRGSFNHRFAQPSRDGHAFSAFFFPTDLFPFTDDAQRDPVSGLEEGLLDRLRDTAAAPRIFYTNSSYEYWGRAASPIHTSVDGRRDVDPPAATRIYHFAGTQHFPDAFPPRRARTRYVANPSNLTWGMRALLVAMEEWITAGTEPPANRFPRIADATLVAPGELAFPAVPGVTVPTRAHEAYRMDYGPRFRSQGIVDRQPPEVGPAFPILVPQVGADGNELGGIRLPEVAVPLGTYTAWNWRAREIGAAGELAPFRGSYFPFAKTPRARDEAADPRPSVEELYPSRNDYLARYTRAALELIEGRYLMAEDLPEMIRHAERLWDLTAQQSGANGGR